jgi:hypothetical protein
MVDQFGLGDTPHDLLLSLMPWLRPQVKLTARCEADNVVGKLEEQNVLSESLSIFDIPETPSLVEVRPKFERRLEASGVVFSHGVISVPRGCLVLISKEPHPNALVYAVIGGRDKFVAEVAGDAPFELVDPSKLPVRKGNYVLTTGKYVHIGPTGYYQFEDIEEE